jgi:hypothetical protein
MGPNNYSTSELKTTNAAAMAAWLTRIIQLHGKDCQQLAHFLAEARRAVPKSDQRPGGFVHRLE